MKKRNLVDLFVYLALIGLGTLAFVLSCRATDFWETHTTLNWRDPL